MIEKRVVIGVIWIEDEPGYDAPQYVLTTDMLDRTQRSEETVENYLISLETLQTMAQTADDRISNTKMRYSSATTTTTTSSNSTSSNNAASFENDSDKENSVPAWARNTSFKKTRNPAASAAAAGGSGGKRKK
jgi:hypothetical protein